jgi:hypothetical protein
MDKPVSYKKPIEFKVPHKLYVDVNVRELKPNGLRGISFTALNANSFASVHIENSNNIELINSTNLKSEIIEKSVNTITKILTNYFLIYDSAAKITIKGKIPIRVPYFIDNLINSAVLWGLTDFWGIQMGFGDEEALQAMFDGILPYNAQTRHTIISNDKPGYQLLSSDSEYIAVECLNDLEDIDNTFEQLLSGMEVRPYSDPGILSISDLPDIENDQSSEFARAFLPTLEKDIAQLRISGASKILFNWGNLSAIGLFRKDDMPDIDALKSPDTDIITHLIR